MSLMPHTLPQTSRPLDPATFRLRPGTTLIEASAGTGKTYTIQYLVLDLLLRGVELREILVVTFTEAATRELRDRLQGFLATVHEVLDGEAEAEGALASVLDRALNELGGDTLRRIVHRALLHVDAASIHTIHGFCQRALQENAFAADVSFQPELCTDPRAMVEELVRDFLRKANLGMGCPLPPSARLQRLQKRARQLTPFLRTDADNTETLEAISAGVVACLNDLRGCTGEVEAIARELLSFQGDLKANVYKDAFFAGLAGLLARVTTDPFSVNEKDLERLCASKIEKSFKKAARGRQVSHRFFKACDAFMEAKSACEDRFLACFDSWFVAEFNRLKAEQGTITYDDMILDLDRALQAREQLRRQLRGRFRAALVDEFQDTDARQYSIFRTLFASPEANEERYFAMIGDPKQSIYAFRGADIRAYLQARKDADARYTLPVNYRSERRVVEGVNRFFSGVDLGEQDSSSEHAIPFQPVRAADQEGKPRLVCAGGLELPGVVDRDMDPPDDGSLNTALKNALQQMVQDVSGLLRRSSEGRVLIEETRDGAVYRRTIRPGDIAVLVDKHSEATELQERFRRIGLLAVRGKSGDIFETEEAEHFLHFLLTCLSPGERHLNVLLVSPLFGKSDAGLKALGSRERQSIHELFSVLGRSWKSGTPISSIWSLFLSGIEARRRLLRRSDGERRLTNYMHVVELVRELERAESLSPERLADAVLEMVRNRSYGRETRSEAHLIRLESDEEAIKLLTMHASKGLEFPIVLLPSLWQRSVQGKYDEVAGAKPDDPDCLAGFVRDEMQVVRRQKSEALRIGYVAATRAIHLCVYYRFPAMTRLKGERKQVDGWFDQWLDEQRAGVREAPANVGFLDALDDVQPLEVPESAAEQTLQPRVLGRTIPDSYQITSYSALSRTVHKRSDWRDDPSVRGGEEEAEAASPPAPAQPDSATENALWLQGFPGGVRTGTFVHDLLEHCDFGRKASWKSLVRNRIERHFPEAGEIRREQQQQEILQLMETLFSTPWPLESGKTLELSGIGSGDRLNEMEFYFPVQAVDIAGLERVIVKWARRNGMTYAPGGLAPSAIDGFLTGSVDLFFRSEGSFHVLDWKTNSPASGLPRNLTSYDAAGIHALMSEGHYYLQALIYTVATSRYLRDRLADAFDFERHVGGFIYCFLRGLGPGTGWFHGTFVEEDIEQAARALGQAHFANERINHV